MENIGAVLRYSGLDFENVVECTVMLADMSEWAAFNKIYVGYFARPSAGPFRLRLQPASAGRPARGRVRRLLPLSGRARLSLPSFDVAS
jgi:2-iminobutanoate/2-iminopropanoate deaminase